MQMVITYSARVVSNSNITSVRKTTHHPKDKKMTYMGIFISVHGEDVISVSPTTKETIRTRVISQGGGNK